MFRREGPPDYYLQKPVQSCLNLQRLAQSLLQSHRLHQFSFHLMSHDVTFFLSLYAHHTYTPPLASILSSLSLESLPSPSPRQVPCRNRQPHKYHHRRHDWSTPTTTPCDPFLTAPAHPHPIYRKPAKRQQMQRDETNHPVFTSEIWRIRQETAWDKATFMPLISQGSQHTLPQQVVTSMANAVIVRTGLESEAYESVFRVLKS